MDRHPTGLRPPVRIGLTLWDSEEAAAETDKFAEQSRASTVIATGVELVERGAYEVVTRT